MRIICKIKTVIAKYLKQKELDKWKKGVSIALEDKEYMALSKELGHLN